ncbi:hypothetical protein GKR75_07980 [Providencia sp. wls1919]|nr:hypothetical protein [Providencia sp. wls1919]
MKDECGENAIYENEEVFNKIRLGLRTKFVGDKLIVIFLVCTIVAISIFVIRKCMFNTLVDSWIFVLIGGCLVGLIISNIIKKYSHCIDTYDNTLNCFLKKYNPHDSLAFSELVTNTRNDPMNFIEHMKIWCDIEEKQYNKVRIKEIENNERIKVRRYDFTD